MTLTYWVAPIKNDASAYNIRARTKKEVLQALAQHDDPASFYPVRKISVEYTDGFDLLDQCLAEGGIYQENM